MNKNISITDIAQAVGLSSMTVSRCLRQETNVRESTREKVLSKAREMGYFYQTRRGRPRRNRLGSPVAQLIVGTLQTNVPLFHLQILVEVEQRLAQKGFNCMVRFSTGDYDIFTRIIEAARRLDSARTILIGDFPDSQLKALQCAFPGVLLLDNPGLPDLDASFSSIGFDNTEAARLATDHLLAQGRSEILLLSGSTNHFFSREFERGYRKAFSDRHLLVAEERILHLKFTPNSTAIRLEQLLEKKIPFNAILTNDEMATEVYRVLAQHRLRIPEDVAVCGCDNIPIGAQLYPSLSTIALNVEELAEQAVHFLCGKQIPFPFRARLLPKLLIRQSSVLQENRDGKQEPFTH